MRDGNHHIVKHVKAGTLATGAVVLKHVWNNGGKDLAKAGVRHAYKYVKERLKTKDKSAEKTMKHNPNKSNHEIKAPSDGVSLSRTVIRYKKAKINKIEHKITEPTRVTVTHVGSKTCGLGYQDAEVTNNLLYGGLAASGHTNGNYNLRELFDTVILDTAAGGAAPLTANTAGRKVYVDKMYLKTLFTSACNTDFTLEIYDFIANVTSIGYSDPLTTWTAAIAGEDYNSTNTYTRYDTRPQQYKEFNMQWKCIGKKIVEMGAGRSHEHKVEWSINRMIEMEYAQRYDTIKGITFSQLFIIKGNKLMTDDTNVTTNQAKVLYECTKSIVGRNIINTPRKVIVYDNMVKSLTNEKMVREFNEDVQTGIFA